ncbi:MAG TPA: hypothetical protein VKJ47_09910, partial [Candidatus Binatia bacterium]|nr:hypothetical protein [Candidatus Binatia bacterium]
SPPYWPRYNGSVEAGIGSLKVRTEARAARQGHAGYWTSDDVAAARDEANALARPRGPAGPSPDEMWSARSPIRDAERQAFAARVSACRSEADHVAGSCGTKAEAVPSEAEMARAAIRRALEECGYLHYTRRQIPPPVPRPNAARIT